MYECMSVPVVGGEWVSGCVSGMDEWQWREGIKSGRGDNE